MLLMMALSDADDDVDCYFCMLHSLHIERCVPSAEDRIAAGAVREPVSRGKDYANSDDGKVARMG